MNAKITITITDLGPGLLASLVTEGEFSDATGIDRRFYSFSSQPPDGIQPPMFWGIVLIDIGQFLCRGPDEAVESPAETGGTDG